MDNIKNNLTSNQEKNMLGDSYQMLDLMHENTLQARIEEYKRPRLQAAETRTNILTELTILQRDMAKDQSENKIDALTKNFIKADKVVQETNKELIQYKEENKVDNQKLICYILVLFAILGGIIALNWLVS